MIIAYRGFSSSEGQITEEGIKLDGKAMLDYIFSRQDIDRTKIVVQGRSLGGSVAVHSLVDTPHKIAGAILENTFTSISDMVDKLFPMVKSLKRFVLRISWDSLAIIDKITCPLLFIKATNDELVPPEHMNALFANAVSSKSKILVRSIFSS